MVTQLDRRDVLRLGRHVMDLAFALVCEDSLPLRPCAVLDMSRKRDGRLGRYT
jgi:hypothetical protein